MRLATSFAMKLGCAFVSLFPLLASSASTASADLVGEPSIVLADVRSAPTPPPEMKIDCPTGPNSPMPDGAAATCAVAVYKGVTFWPFAYRDNRVSVGLVGYASGRMVSQQELTGSRYIWRADIDSATQTVKFSGQDNQSAQVSWDDLAVIPEVASLQVSEAPKPPSEMKISCATGPNSPAPDGRSATCPVVKNKGIVFWPFSYIDNRGSLGLVGYKSGQIVSRKELIGARYVWSAVVNAQKKTVDFSGQSNRVVSVAWANLPNIPLVNAVNIATGPRPPAGMKNYCATDGLSYPSETCPVITYDNISYWPFSYFDNRVAIGLVGYKSGQVVSQQELPGARYIWRANVNSSDMSIQLVGQSNQTVTVPWTSLPNVPVVTYENVAGAPNPPAGLKLTCTNGPTSGTSFKCPVVSYSGIKFWAFSYIDNRVSLGLVGYKDGALVSQQELVGARYVWDATVDARNKTVSFYGQANQVVSISWPNLK